MSSAVRSVPRRAYLAAVAWLAACSPAGGSAAGAIEQGVPVRVAQVDERWVSRPITAAGVVSAREEIALSFKVGGIVSRVLVREGDAVRRGQVLATLDLREIDAQVARARSGAEKAHRDMERATRLYEDSVATLEQLQNARTGADVARFELEAASVNRQYAVITAPVDGRVLRRAIEAGELASAGTPAIVVGSTSAGAVIRVGLADRDAVRIRLGDPAVVTFDAWPGERFAGRVTRLPAATSPGTRAHEVEIAFDARSVAPASGMVGEVVLSPREGRRMHVVPLESLLEADGSRAYVFTLDAAGERARRVPVRIAAMVDDAVAVAEGLDGVDRVIADGAEYVNEGSPVRIVP